MCVCVQLQDVYAVEYSVCFLYADVCTVMGLVIRSPAFNQSHPLVPAFLSKASTATVKPFWGATVFD